MDIIQNTGIIELWNNIFFEPEYVITSSVVRIMVGTIAFFHFIKLFPVRELLFGENSIYPYEEFEKGAWCRYRLSLYSIRLRKLWNPSLYMLIGMVASFCMAIGYCTTFAIFMTYLAVSSYMNRVTWCFTGGDSLFRQLLLWLFFTSCGNALSVDCWLASTDMFNQMANPIGVRALQFLMLSVYWTTVDYKTNHAAWQKGYAIYNAVHINNVRGWGMPAWSIDKVWKNKILCWGTLVTELSMIPGLIFMPYVFVPIGLLLHLAFGLVFNLALFSYAVSCYLILFVPPEFFINLFKMLGYE
jgi:hypothetical protein